MTEWHRNMRKIKPFSDLLLCELNSTHCCWHTSLKGCLGLEIKAVLFLFKYYILGGKKNNGIDSLQILITYSTHEKKLHLNIFPFLKRSLLRALTVGGVAGSHMRGPGQIPSATWSGWGGVLPVVSASQRHRQEDPKVKMFLSSMRIRLLWADGDLVKMNMY